MFADDTQSYISYSIKDSLPALSHLSVTLDSVQKWLSFNRLSLNPSKMEFLIIGTPQQRAKLDFTPFTFLNTTIPCSPCVRNLGVLFESDLSLDKHISTICKNSYQYIRQIRPVLDQNSSILLANALFTQRLDFCNSLYIGLPKSSLNKLQLVQNSLARSICLGIQKFDHITPILHNIHCSTALNKISH